MKQNRIEMIFLHGKPGSGKGTQATEILKHFSQLEMLYPGQLIRNLTIEDSHIVTLHQRHIQPYLDVVNNGGLVPAEEFFKFFTPLLDLYVKNGKTTLLFDGFPKNSVGWEKMSDFMMVLKKSRLEVNTLHLYFAISNQEALRRIETRSLETSERLDDRDTVALRRIEVFRSETLPMLRLLCWLQVLTIIRAMKSKEKIFETIFPLISTFLYSEK